MKRISDLQAMPSPIKTTSRLIKAASGMHYMPIDADVAALVLDQMGKRVICTINKQYLHCALQHNKRVGHYIAMGKSSLQKLDINANMTLEIMLTADTSPYQTAIPREFEAVLDTDPVARKRFEQLTPGKQRSLLHMVARAKHSDTRINRSLSIAEKLKMGLTDLRDLRS